MKGSASAHNAVQEVQASHNNADTVRHTAPRRLHSWESTKKRPHPICSNRSQLRSCKRGTKLVTAS